ATLIGTVPQARQDDFAVPMEAIAAEAQSDVSVLERVLKVGDSETRRRTANALGAIGAATKGATSDLTDVLNRPELSLESKCAVVGTTGSLNIYRAKTTEALLYLALNDGDPGVKAAAREALLGQIASS
ncbi:MAG: hypothetical protein ACR2Q4_12905, partial [Geminicoccaceae bacterium]